MNAASEKEPEMFLPFILCITLTSLTLPSAITCCPPAELLALISFKSSLRAPQVGVFDSWSGPDCCSNWYGLTCNPETGSIAEVTLRAISEEPIFEEATKPGYMTGIISPSLCQLKNLSSLIVTDWKGISGEIPSCLTSLSSLRIINLAGNRLSGMIPKDINKLSHLTVLDVADNKLTGCIPVSITRLSSLMHMDLRNNLLTGRLPHDFGQLRMLSRALLSGNKLTGTIPSSMSKIYRLADLDLSMNMISGQIPASLGKMPVLETLNLDSNRITGAIPPTLIRSRVSNMNLSNNGIDGTIPDVFRNKSYFMVLDLSFNNLKGKVPKSIQKASYVGHLDLSHNHLCGRIPAGSPFDRLEASSFTINDCLCGEPLKDCEENH